MQARGWSVPGVTKECEGGELLEQSVYENVVGREVDSEMGSVISSPGGL